MAKIKMAIVDPIEFNREVYGLLQVDPSAQLFCQIMHASEGLLHHLSIYGADVAPEGWSEDLRAVADLISDYLSNCESRDLEALNRAKQEFFGDSDPVLYSVCHLINSLGYKMISDEPKGARKEAASEWYEYIRDSLISFWRTSGGEGMKSFSGIGGWFSSKKEDIENYADERQDGLVKGMTKSFREEVVDPALQYASDTGRNVAIGLMVGIGAGILIWLAYTGTKSAGSVATAITPQGRAASRLLR